MVIPVRAQLRDRFEKQYKEVRIEQAYDANGNPLSVDTAAVYVKGEKPKAE